MQLNCKFLEQEAWTRLFLLFLFSFFFFLCFEDCFFPEAAFLASTTVTGIGCIIEELHAYSMQHEEAIETVTKEYTWKPTCCPTLHLSYQSTKILRQSCGSFYAFQLRWLRFPIVFQLKMKLEPFQDTKP